MDPHSVLERHKASLLAIPGATAVAIGKKSTGGTSTDVDSIVVFVARKGDPPQGADRVPAEIEGVPTDVVERVFDFRPLATNPFERLDPLIGGISLTAIEDPQAWGTIGCFIAADGAVAGVPAGPYLLTNMHVVQVAAAVGANRRVIQPGRVKPPVPANYVCGEYVTGLRNATHDCAITTILGRGWRNEVPNHPWQPGRRNLTGLAAAALNDQVYKYGATSQHTTGTIANLNFNAPGINNAIYIVGEAGGAWCDQGDSGAAVILYSDDRVLALLFSADTNTPVPGGYLGGLAYDITTQILVFSGVAQLA
jgi:hypothetical protein